MSTNPYLKLHELTKKPVLHVPIDRTLEHLGKLDEVIVILSKREVQRWLNSFPSRIKK